MEENITEKLLDKIFYLQEQLAEKRQESKEDFKRLKQLADAYKKLETRREDDKVYAFLGGIIFTIFFYLLIKFCLYYFF